MTYAVTRHVRPALDAPITSMITSHSIIGSHTGRFGDLSTDFFRRCRDEIRSLISVHDFKF